MHVGNRDCKGLEVDGSEEGRPRRSLRLKEVREGKGYRERRLRALVGVVKIVEALPGRKDWLFSS